MGFLINENSAEITFIGSQNMDMNNSMQLNYLVTFALYL